MKCTGAGDLKPCPPPLGQRARHKEMERYAVLMDARLEDFNVEGVSDIAEVDNEDNSKRGQDDEDSSTPILIFGAVGRPDDMVLPGARRVRRVPTSDELRDLRLQLSDLRLGWGTASATCPRFRRALGINKLTRQAEEHHRKSHDACKRAVQRV